jgi:hypothetical protein
VQLATTFALRREGDWGSIDNRPKWRDVYEWAPGGFFVVVRADRLRALGRVSRRL